MGLLVALSVNGVTRSAAAFVAGGPRFGWRVMLALAADMVAAWVYALWVA